MENGLSFAAVGNLGGLREWIRANPSLVNERFGTSQSTLLFVAARGGQLAVVRYLIDECRADVNATCMHDLTPLHGAAYAGHDYVVEFLATSGAQLRKNSRGQTAIDAACEVCQSKTPDMQRRCVELLTKHYLKAQVQPPPVAAAPPQQASAAPAATGSPGFTSLPDQVAEVLFKVGTGWTWRLTAHDYVLSGLQGYTYQGNRYFTPVDLFYPIDGSMAYCCRVDMNNLGGLTLSPKATESYLDVFTGSLRLVPFLYQTLLLFLDRGVTGQFEQTPPLAQRQPSKGIPQRDKSFLRSIQRHCSTIADNCFQFNPTANSISGSIPIATVSPMSVSLVPVLVKFLPADNVGDNGLPSNDVPKPLVFVVPPPDTMVLVPTTHVEAGTGQVIRLPCQAAPWHIDLLSTLLREMQEVFTRHVPLRFRTPEDSVIRRPAQPAAASPPLPAPLASPAVASPAGSSGKIEAKSSPVNSDMNDSFLCLICLDRQKTHLVMPCRHLTFCKECAADYKTRAMGKNANLCPTCRQPIQSMVEIFI